MQRRLKDDEQRFREEMAKPGATVEAAAKAARVQPRSVQLYVHRLAAHRPTRKEKAAAALAAGKESKPVRAGRAFVKPSEPAE